MIKTTMFPRAVCAFVCAALISLTASAQNTNRLEIVDGDRVLLLGDTLIEREQEYCHLELRLHERFKDRQFIVRNLGWSADTPRGTSRSSFDFREPEKVFTRLKEQIAQVKPTLVILGYGMANSFDGMDAVGPFKSDMAKLMDAIEQIAGGKDKVRFMVVSPIRHERMPAPLPDPTAHNKVLEAITAALRDLAKERNAWFTDLFRDLRDGPAYAAGHFFTDNGIHLSNYGYGQVAELIDIAMNQPAANWRFSLLEDGKLREGSFGSTVTNSVRTRASFSATVLNDNLEPARHLEGGKPMLLSPGLPVVQILGLEKGSYTLFIDGKEAARGTDVEWRRSLKILAGAQAEQIEELRRTIIEKNRKFFHRWRPQNETYLFGFRRHEQGRNAKEIPMFDPIIADYETRIAQLRQPKPRKFELKPSVAETASTTKASAFLSGVAVAAQQQVKPVFSVAPGFEVSLWAENPLLAKPIQMNFDTQGRLWVASSEVYPQIAPGEKANDKVIILQDTQGRGVADKATVFADGLLIPTGVEPGDGGAYVGQSTQLLHLKDTDGDGVADEKRIVLSGFGTEDTHHILHTLKWAPSGSLFFNQSIYIHSHIETPNGVVRAYSGAVHDFNPRTQQLSVFLKGFCNPWGHQFDDYGQSFVTDGAGGQGISWGIDGASYFTYSQMRRELRSVSPGSYPKFCGLEIINSPLFPQDWQGNMVTCDFRAHRIVRFGIEEQGSGYQTKELPDLLRTTNVTFRPIDVKLGPDGALYIADWSNPIIQHGEVDFRDRRRDKENGRIWRVAPVGKTIPMSDIRRSEAATIVAKQLSSPVPWDRQRAQRVVAEKGTNSVDALKTELASTTSDLNRLRLLWAFQSVGSFQPELLDTLLKSSDGRVRAGAVRLLNRFQSVLTNAVPRIETALDDDHPRVRLEAIRALAGQKTPRSAELALASLEKAMDPFLDYAVWLTVNDLAEVWLNSLKTGSWKPAGREKQLEFGLKAIEPALAAGVLDQLIGSEPLPRDGSGPWIDLIGKAGSQETLGKMFSQVLADGFDAGAATKSLAALADAARIRNVRPSGDLGKVAGLFANEPVRDAAFRLAGQWRLAAAIPALSEAATRGGSGGAVAIQALRDVGGDSAADALRGMTGKERPADVRRSSASALAAIDFARSEPAIVGVLLDQTDEAGALGLWRSLLSVRGVPARMTKALPKTGIPPVVAQAGVRASREGGRNEPELILALSRGAGLEESVGGLSDAEMKRLAADALSKGDPHRGEAVYRRVQLGCVNCHAIGGAGGRVGPDMTSIGASAPADYLVESLLYPNRKVKEGYQSVLVTRKDGEEQMGILVRETNEELVLRDAVGGESSIAKRQIQTRTTGASLMPAGLIDGLGQEEKLDLVRFLTELGKPGAFDASKGNVARVWALHPRTIDVRQFGDEKLVEGGFRGKGWTTVMTTVDGRLPASAFTDSIKSIQWREPDGVYAAAKFNSSGTGEISIKLAGGIPSNALIDGKAVSISGSEVKARVAAGPHSLLLRFDAPKLPGEFRAELSSGSFLGTVD